MATTIQSQTFGFEFEFPFKETTMKFLLPLDKSSGREAQNKTFRKGPACRRL